MRKGAEMNKVRHLVLIATACAATLILAQSAAASPPDVVCSGAFPVSFSGMARNLIVPAGLQYCGVDGATIEHDLVVEEGAYVSVSNTTIGHNLTASKPGGVITGFTEDGGGPVNIGHDVVISGPFTDEFGNNSCCPDLNDLTVGHDLRITNLLVSFEIAASNDDVGHDLVVSGNTTGICCGFGPIAVSENSVGHNLIVTNNTAPGGDFGWITVFENQVKHDATCAGNSPPESKNTPAEIGWFGRLVGPNIVGHIDSCD
jgi:hypothetical protein